MATKKGKRKVTKKAKAVAKKRGSTARPKKAGARRPKKTAARKSPSRKASGQRAAQKKPGVKKLGRRAPVNRAKAARPVRRQDRPGHLDPRYAAQLREQSGPSEHDPAAFIDRPRSPGDDLAEELGEGVVERATTAAEDAEEMLDQIVPEERGGPFVETSGGQEFAEGVDESNPKGAKREPFPTT